VSARRPAPAGQVEVGPWRSGHEWMRRAACRAPDVDQAWFTVDEDAPDADALIARAKRACQVCPVRLWCRIHADETGEYGVYAAETHTERLRRQARWRHAVAQLEASGPAVGA
jgi:WhiB family transcriptional regulator, redox-sensing transcriptional regulator